MIEAVQFLRLSILPLNCAFFRIEPDGLKDRGQGGDEVFQPGREIGLNQMQEKVIHKTWILDAML